MKEDKINNNIKSKTKRNIFLIIAIIVGIIAIVYSAYILNLKPYVAELEKRDRDPARIENLSLIDSALTKLRDTNQNISWGDQNRVYVSLPSYSANCSGLDLPSLPDDWEYRCKTEADYQNINGSGWLPVDFTKLPKDSVILNSFQDLLPTDPVNTSDSGYYYAYVSGENNDYVLTSLLESDEHLKKTASKDGGSDPARLEVGSNLQLWVKVSGLVGYWNFDEGEGEIVKDLSGNNNNGTLFNSPEVIDGKIGKALNLNGVDSYLEIPANTIFDFTDKLTLMAWIKMSTMADSGIIVRDAPAAEIYNLRYGRGASNQFSINMYVGSTLYQAQAFTPSLNEWYNVVGTYDGTIIKLYVNGILQTETNANGNINSSSGQPIGIGKDIPNNDISLNGFIDDVRIYNKALTINEVQAIYIATK